MYSKPKSIFMKRISAILAAAVVLAACGSNRSDKQIIENFYNAVLGRTEMTDALLKKSLSDSILSSLWEADYPDTYSYWAFRTGFQDGPGNVSQVDGIETLGDGWYRVSYQDMGTPGVTEVKVEGGKITDYRPFRVPYTQASNYYKRNDIEDVLPTKITSQEQLNQFFGMAAFMGRGGEPTKIDFGKSFVIPVIVPETNLETEIIINGIYHSRPDALTLSYSVIQGEEPQTYTIAPFSLLIVDNIYRDCTITLENQ